MYRIASITPGDPEFSQVLNLRYRLLDEPVGMPEITEPSENDRNPNNLHSAIFDKNMVVAAVRLDKESDAEYVVRRMVVAPEYQRRGIGRRAMQILEIIAQELGGERIRLNSTPEAIDFYHVLGYEDTGDGMEWAGVYHTEMTKDI